MKIDILLKVTLAVSAFFVLFLAEVASLLATAHYDAANGFNMQIATGTKQFMDLILGDASRFTHVDSSFGATVMPIIFIATLFALLFALNTLINLIIRTFSMSRAKFNKFFLLLLLVFTIIASLIWITVMRVPLYVDPAAAFSSTLDTLKSGSLENYFLAQPQQIGLFYVHSTLIFLFGNYSVIAFLVLNGLLLLITYFTICRTIPMLFNNEKTLTTTILLLFFCHAPIFLLTYVYNDLLYITFSFLTLYAILKALTTSKIRYIPLSFLYATLLLVFKKNGLILMIAIGIVIIYKILRNVHAHKYAGYEIMLAIGVTLACALSTLLIALPSLIMPHETSATEWKPSYWITMALTPNGDELRDMLSEYNNSTHENNQAVDKILPKFRDTDASLSVVKSKSKSANDRIDGWWWDYKTILRYRQQEKYCSERPKCERIDLADVVLDSTAYAMINEDFDKILATYKQNPLLFLQHTVAKTFLLFDNPSFGTLNYTFGHHKKARDGYLEDKHKSENIINYNLETEEAKEFINSHGMSVLENLNGAFKFIVILFAAIWTLLNRKKITLLHALLLLTFIGGTVFHIFIWEIRPRYFIMYFLLLLPFAADARVWNDK
ncbi:MAG: hypothetical protein LBL41_01200 [Bifidobacteriaceae bacterium]|jgi:hypothetical protein|nr:hypothetical protein [Bifidobacteriaceae bacterium]